MLDLLKPSGWQTSTWSPWGGAARGVCCRLVLGVRYMSHIYVGIWELDARYMVARRKATLTLIYKVVD